MRARLCTTTLLLTAGLAGLTASASAQDKKLGWADTAELSYIATSGNAEASSLALRNTLTHTWESALFKLEAGAFRAETTTLTRTLVGGQVVEDEDTKVSAESYFLRGRYDRNLSPRFFWFAGAGWERNELAGLSERTSAVGGVGRIFADQEGFKLKADLGLTYTQEDLVVEPPGYTDSFLGVRASYDLSKALTSTTTLTSVLVVDGNLDDTSDYRADFTNAVAVAMTQRLALKASLQLLYDSEPGFVVVTAGPLLPAFQIVQLDELDSIFSVALVVSF